MNIYKLSQKINTEYDTYDSVIVVAESKKDARTIHPSKYVTHVKDNMWMGTYAKTERTIEQGISGKEYKIENDCWISFEDIDKIKVELIGYAQNQKRGVVLASYNAG